jgi:predicted small integral membrane protein
LPALPELSPEVTLALARTVVLGGLAAWLTLAVVNNILDPGTNIHLLGTMMRMSLIEEDPAVGRGLLRRAVRSEGAPRFVLAAVIIVQVIVCVLLWWATLLLGQAAAAGGDHDQSQSVATLALTAFAALWFVFLIGGLWFGYWIKTPQVQQVHFTLLTVSILALLLVNLPA